MDVKTKNSKKAMSLLANFLRNKTLKMPGFNKGLEKRVKNLLLPDDIGAADDPGIFPLTSNDKVQHEALEAYIALYKSIMDLSGYQHYFRRFPFKEKDVSKADYIRMTCENYLSAFYVVKMRLRNYLDRMKKVGCISNKSVGLIIKNFNQRFYYELKERNFKHHRHDFNTENIARLSMLELLGHAWEETTELFDSEHRREFKRYMRHWYGRVVLRSQHVSEYLDIASQILIAPTSFIHAKNGFECQGMVNINISDEANNCVSNSLSNGG